MMAAMLQAIEYWPLFLGALSVWGFAPNLALRAILLMFEHDDPRRDELLAEIHAVPRWERPFWVSEQLEVGLREGLFARVAWWANATLIHPAHLESGVESSRDHPETFWIPSADEKAALRPGDDVRLMWSVRRSHGERMWVRITQRNGDEFTGTLENWPVMAYLRHGDLVRFQADHIIDYLSAEDEESEAPATTPPPAT